jgi:hypothetical protein
MVVHGATRYQQHGGAEMMSSRATVISASGGRM